MLEQTGLFYQSHILSLSVDYFGSSEGSDADVCRHIDLSRYDHKTFDTFQRHIRWLIIGDVFYLFPRMNSTLQN